MLEVRVHLGSVLPRDPFEISVIQLPDELVADLAPAALAAGWNDVPPAAPSHGVGDAWLTAATSAALRVPSIHSASDHSILLNPAHPLAGRAELVATRAYLFDSRLFAR